jgi:hypothetical protein
MANLIDDKNKALRPPAFAETPKTKVMDALTACQMLMSKQCVCKGTKKVRNAFCLDCYLKLTPDMQKALYQRVGHGFEQAYSAAKEWLLA